MSVFTRRLFGMAKTLRDKLRRHHKQAHLETLKARGLRIGERVSFEDGCFLDPSHCFLISIGDQVVFAPNVRLIAHDASTRYAIGHTRLGRINMGSRCFIGDSVIVLPGVTIGDDCIIGAGSVVTHDIPGNSVAAGNPARVRCTMDEYRLKHRERAQQGTTFNADYARDNLDDVKRQQMLDAVDKGPTYII
jgi:maltose O-acetyltransferase